MESESLDSAGLERLDYPPLPMELSRLHRLSGPGTWLCHGSRQHFSSTPATERWKPSKRCIMRNINSTRELILSAIGPYPWSAEPARPHTRLISMCLHVPACASELRFVEPFWELGSPLPLGNLLTGMYELDGTSNSKRQAKLTHTEGRPGNGRWWWWPGPFWRDYLVGILVCVFCCSQPGPFSHTLIKSRKSTQLNFSNGLGITDSDLRNYMIRLASRRIP